jgi:3-oxoacyl-[acyl-carrier protein] reductase
MLKDIEGKVCIITGSSSGIGAALARQLAELGARLVLHGHRNREGAEAIVSECERRGAEAALVMGDILEPATVRALVDTATERFGGLDVLVNNAGSMLGRVPIADAPEGHLEKVVDLNVRSVYDCCRAAIPVMRARGGGSIINTTSIAGRTGGAGGAGIYGSAKAMVSSLTRALARELAPDSIRVNAVSPGVIATPFHERYSDRAFLEGAKAQIPMHRLGTPEDCAGAYVYFASEAMSGYVTGQILEVNGGQLMP